MRNLFLLFFWFILISSKPIYPQITFLGIDQEQCGLMEDHPYFLDNYIDCVDGAGYAIYKNGALVFMKCPYPWGTCVLKKFLVLNDSTVFTIEYNFDGGIPYLKAYKSQNSCSSFNQIASPQGNLTGDFFLLTQNSGLLVTYANGPPMWETPQMWVRMVPSGGYYHVDDFTQDQTFFCTISDSLLCELDSLSFSISIDNGITHYTIIWDSLWLNNKEIHIKRQFRIYPNPSGNYFAFNETNLPDFKSVINLYNFKGEHVSTFAVIMENRYNIHDLPSGLYLIDVEINQQRNLIKMLKL